MQRAGQRQRQKECVRFWLVPGKETEGGRDWLVARESGGARLIRVACKCPLRPPRGKEERAGLLQGGTKGRAGLRFSC